MVRKGQVTMQIKPLPADRVEKGATITLANNKGGVGKTTLATALGLYASRTGRNILLIDLDSQSNLSQRVGLPDAAFLDRRLNMFFRHFDVDNSDADNMNFPIAVHYPWFYRVPGVESKPGQIAIIAGSHDAVYAAEYINKTLSNAKFVRNDKRNLFERFNDALTQFRKYYDYVVIDTAPALEGSVLGDLAVRAADVIVVPVDGIEAGLGLSHLVQWVDLMIPEYDVIKRPNLLFVMNKYQEDTGDIRDVMVEYADDDIRNVIFRALKANMNGFVCDNGIKETPSLKNTVYAGFGRKNKYDPLCEEIFSKSKPSKTDAITYYNEHSAALDKDLTKISKTVLRKEPMFLIPRFMSVVQEADEDVTSIE